VRSALAAVAIAAVCAAALAQSPDEPPDEPPEEAPEEPAGSAAAAPTAHEACRPVALRTASGLAIRGVEDMILLPGEPDRLVLSAYDRAAGDDDAAAGAAGLYALPLDVLEGLEESADAPAPVRLSDAFQADTPLFPHGIGARALPAGGYRVAAVNRRRGARGGRGTVIELFDLSGSRLEHRATVRDPRLCRANDVVPTAEGGVLATLDGRACQGFDRAMELVMAPRRGRIVAVAPPHPPGGGDPSTDPLTVLADGLAFANGLAVAGDRLIAAQTRDGSVIHRPLAAPGAEGTVADATVTDATAVDGVGWTRIPVDGGPDNLGIAADGGLLAAVHESLPALAIHRLPLVGPLVERLLGHALGGWHVTHIDPATGRTRTILTDIGAPVFPAATVAVATPAGLVLGSVTQAGLLWCPGLAAGPAS